MKLSESLVVSTAVGRAIIPAVILTGEALNKDIENM